MGRMFDRRGFNCSVCGYPVLGKLYALDRGQPTRSICHRQCGIEFMFLREVVLSWRKSDKKEVINGHRQGTTQSDHEQGGGD